MVRLDLVGELIMAKQILKRLTDSGVKSIDANAGIANDNFDELFARTRGKVIGAIGDSIVAGCNFNVGISALAVADGVLTATTSAIHRSHAGNKFYIYGADQEAINGPVLTIGTTITTATLGNVTATDIANISAVTGSDVRLASLCTAQLQDWLGMACSYSNGAFERGVPLGFSGKSANYMQQKLPYLVATNPDIIVELSGINDIKSLSSSATDAQVTALAESIFTTRRATWQAILEAGKLPVIATITPISNDYVGYTGKWMYCTLAHNRMIREFCRSNPEYILADFYNVVVDKASATGNYVTGGSADALHFVHKSARLCAIELKNTLERVYGTVPTRNPYLATNRNEYYGANSAIKQLNANPTGAGGVGGTLSGGATGTCWTAWTLTGSEAVVGSNITNEDGSVSQVITVTGHAGGDVVFTTPAYASQVVAGDKARAIVPVNQSSAVNLTNVRIQLNIQHTGITANVETNYPSSGGIDQGDWDCQLVTPEFIVTATGNATLKITITFTNGGGGVFTFQPPAMVKY